VADLAGILVRVVRGLLGGQQSHGGVVIALRNGSVLLVHARYRRSWTTPGGFLADGEDPLTGALRELKEETGLTGTGKLVGSDFRRGHTDYVVVADTLSGEPRCASWEIREVRWFAPSELPPLHPITSRLLVGPLALVRNVNGCFVVDPDAPVRSMS
jgi:ADP-ribose pyrophosphatase YjhB (NUDIX family)